MIRKRDEKHWVTALLSQKDFDRLDAICQARGQSKADFLRGAMRVHRLVPNINTRPNARNKRLRGAPMDRHLARVEQTKRQPRRKG